MPGKTGLNIYEFDGQARKLYLARKAERDAERKPEPKMKYLETAFLIFLLVGAAVALFFLIMAWTSKPVCAGKLVSFTQNNVEGDMEPFGFLTKFGDIGMNPTVPGTFCIEVRKMK